MVTLSDEREEGGKEGNEKLRQESSVKSGTCFEREDEREQRSKRQRFIACDLCSHKKSHVYRLFFVFAVVACVLHNFAVFVVVGKIIFRVFPRALVQDVFPRLIILHKPENEARKKWKQEHRDPQVWAKSIAQREATLPQGARFGIVIFEHCMMTRQYDHTRVEPRR
jgi:hypothetical protein